MNELQTIREALEQLDSWRQEGALEALSILEARMSARMSAMLDSSQIADLALNRGAAMEARDHTSCDEWIEARRVIGAEIGQYAYRYSEDIRKDRDYWQKTATAFHDAVHQHIKNHTPIKSECQGCEGQGLDCAESCLRPKK